jgi:hypothetical protein
VNTRSNVTTLGVRSEYAVCTGHRISSEVHLDTVTGLLVGRMRTRSTVALHRFQSGVQALVIGSSGAVLAAGPLNAYEIGSSLVRHHERTDIWVWRVPRIVAGHASEIALAHTWNPARLRNLRLADGTVAAIKDLLDDAKLGELAIGGEMSWPVDELPWATWPDGHVRSGIDDEEVIALPRALRTGSAHVQ